MTEALIIACNVQGDGQKSHRIGWIKGDGTGLSGDGFVGCLDCKTPVEVIPETDQKRQTVRIPGGY